MRNYELARRFLLPEPPIPNLRQLGLDPRSPYINAGILVIDLQKWRAANLTEELIRFTAAHFEHNVSADQYAINCCLTTRRTLIDPRWTSSNHFSNTPAGERALLTPRRSDNFRKILGSPISPARESHGNRDVDTRCKRPTSNRWIGRRGRALGPVRNADAGIGSRGINGGPRATGSEFVCDASAIRSAVETSANRRTAPRLHWLGRDRHPSGAPQDDVDDAPAQPLRRTTSRTGRSGRDVNPFTDVGREAAPVGRSKS